MDFVAYYRVSTAKQGRSGLGLEAQKMSVQGYTSAKGGRILKEFIEVESGKINERPQLLEALRYCEITGATLIIAKLDRLSRNAAFLLTLRDSGVRFVAADMEGANDMTIGIMAVIAQEERKAISTRTKDALAAAKVRGVKLGSPKGAIHLHDTAMENSQKARRRIVEKADGFAAKVAPAIHQIRTEEGITTLRGIATELNRRGIKTPRGSAWTPTAVKNLIARIDF